MKYYKYHVLLHEDVHLLFHPPTIPLHKNITWTGLVCCCSITLWWSMNRYNILNLRINDPWLRRNSPSAFFSHLLLLLRPFLYIFRRMSGFMDTSPLVIHHHHYHNWIEFNVLWWEGKGRKKILRNWRWSINHLLKISVITNYLVLHPFRHESYSKLLYYIFHHT